jgi:dienelactone hydrolase
MRLVLAPFLVLILAGSGGAQDPGREALARPFAYEQQAPLDAKLVPLYERHGARVHSLEYSSPRGGTVTGYLVTPEAAGPFAGLVFGHWGGGNGTEFLPEAQLYAEAGAVSVLIDYPWVRPSPWRVGQGRGLSEPEKDRDSWIAAVVDLRRALDVLLARPGVDAKRVGYVGHSYGAQWGAILSAVDRRMKASVLMAGVPSTESITADSVDPDMLALLQATPKPEQDRYFELNRPFDAIRYVPHAAPIPLFFQFALHERILSEAAMKRYYDAASEPKAIAWYDTGHDLNDVRALADRAAWLEQRLSLKPMRPLLQKRIEPTVR